MLALVLVVAKLATLAVSAIGFHVFINAISKVG